MTGRNALRLVAPLLTLAVLGCQRQSGTEPEAPPPPTCAVRAAAARVDPDARPRLVLSVVYDQLATHALARVARHLHPDGLLRTAMADGVHVERLRFAHAATYTAPGHATLYTGTSPRAHGVASNAVWDGVRGAVVQAVDDGRSAVVGHPGRFASPAVLAVPGVADALKAGTDGRGRVVSLSIKDRGAVLPGGRAPDAALFFDGAVGGFTTAEYVATARPAWLVDFEARAGVVDLAPWLVDVEGGYPDVGPDDRAGEADYPGFGRVFPHEPRAARSPGGLWPLLPTSSERLVATAREAACALDLGADDAPDLLAVSVSGTDYAGHAFGPGSWEFTDHLRRADRALGALYRELAAHVPTAVTIASDHGVAPLPEVGVPGDADDPDFGPYREAWDATRVRGDVVQATAEAALDRVLGDRPDAPWIVAFAEPYLVQSDWGEDAGKAAEATTALITALEALPGLARVLHVGPTDLVGDDPIVAAVRASVPALDGTAYPGSYYLVLAPGATFDLGYPGGAGTSHGSPYVYDTDVPAVFAGAGVNRRGVVVTDPVDAGRFAPTVAALLGVPAPATMALPPIPVAQDPDGSVR